MTRHSCLPTARSALLMLALALVACAPPDRSTAPEGRDGTAAASPPAASPAVGASDDAVDLSITAPTPVPIDVHGTVASFWWHNQEISGALSLRPEQVAAMDAVATAYLEGWNAAIQARREGPNRIAAALADGDGAAASRAADRYADALAYVEAGHQRLKIAVVALLDRSQREALVASQPQLLRDPWVVGRRLGQPRRQRPR